jgi:hypothetical protein
LNQVKKWKSASSIGWILYRFWFCGKWRKSVFVIPDSILIRRFNLVEDWKKIFASYKWDPGLPDFSCYNIPKLGKMYQIIRKYIPNNHKMYQITIKCTKWL